MDINKLIGFETVISKENIPNTDKIELIKLSGWNCICTKNQYNINDKVLHIRIDTDINSEKLHFSNFVSKTKWIHLKTKKIKDVYSQGLIIGKIINDNILIDNNILLINDLSTVENIEKILGIRKHISLIDSQVSNNKLYFPSDIIGKTDELNAQSNITIFKDVISNEHYITLKMDGSSLTLIWKDNKMTLCSRNCVISESLLLRENELDKNFINMNNFIKNNKYEDILRSKYLDKNIVFQGEFCGPKINGNNLRLTNYEWFIFTIKDLDTNKFSNYNNMLEIVKYLGFKLVPLIGTFEGIAENKLNTKLEFYQKLSDSLMYSLNNINLYETSNTIKKLTPGASQQAAEGVVIRNTFDKYNNDKPYGCKIINRNY